MKMEKIAYDVSTVRDFYSRQRQDADMIMGLADLLFQKEAENKALKMELDAMKLAQSEPRPA
jgi:hypothetical protein